MAEQGTIQETMTAVMQAHDIVRRFHRNVVDLFRTISIDLESRDIPYCQLGDEGGVLLSPSSPLLRESNSWLSKHIALPLQPVDEPDAPILLVHIAVDKKFAAVPEVWLGVLSSLQSYEGEAYPYEDAVSYIFEDYFGPEDEWSVEGKWYEVSFGDDVVAADMAFCRLPLATLRDQDAVIREVCDRLYARVEEWADEDDQDD